MQLRVVIRLLGVLLALYSLGFAPSLMVSLWYSDGEAIHFLESMLVTMALGVTLWLPVRKDRHELQIRDGFLVVALFWCVLGMMGALPFYLGVHLNLTDSIFEAVSGFTTTGATVIAGLDDLPPSILYHRQGGRGGADQPGSERGG